MIFVGIAGIASVSDNFFIIHKLVLDQADPRLVLLLVLKQMDAPKRQDVCDAIKPAVREGLEIVRKIESQNLPIDSHDFYPNLSYLEPGFPRFSFARRTDKRTDVPRNYTTIFKDQPAWYDEYRIKEGSIVVSKDIPSWQEFLTFVQGDDYLRKHLGPTSMFRDFAEKYEETGDKTFSIRDFVDRLFILGLVRKLVDRYVNVSKTTEFDDQIFLPLYLEWEKGLFERTLPFDILVPILRVKFDFDELQISNSSAIERMSDAIQLARGHKHSSDMSAHQDVIGAATHALVLRNWQLDDYETRERAVEALNYIGTLMKPIADAEKFFASLRGITGVLTGFCQIIIKPKGWADHWNADLPCIHIVSKRGYTEQLEKISWSDPAPGVNADECARVGELHNVLIQTSNNRLTLAAKRLNAASLRSDEEDSIVDVTIALEALLGDESKGEITHKLATRLAALARLEPFKDHTPAEVFGFCKKIYSFRSAVAHGSHETSKSRIVNIREEKVIPTVDLGLDMLGFALQVLSKNQQYLDPHKLDLYLVSHDGA